MSQIQKDIKNIKKQPDSLCKAGVIISIVLGSLVMISSLTSAILCFWSKDWFLKGDIGKEFEKLNINMNIVFNILGIFIIICLVFQIVTLILNINVLRGKAKSNITCGIFSLIFAGLIGGVLILIGKYQIASENQVNDSEIFNQTSTKEI